MVHIFDLYALETQEAYLIDFFDAVAEYLNRESSDLDAFLAYWDSKLCKKTVPAGEIQGLRIYSIHNSKGLEFHTVLMPFCDWKMEKEVVNDTVWCAPPEAPYDQVDILPIAYGPRMNQSVYHPHFLQERLELWVDNLNVLYVAFTRAANNLSVWGRGKRAKNTVYQL